MIVPFAMGFVLPTQLALHIWPSWSYIHGVRSDYLALYISLVDVMVVIVLIAYYRDTVQLIRKSHAGLILLIGLLVATNTIVSYAPFHTLVWWIRLLSLGLALYTILRSGRKSLSMMLWGLVGVSILQSALVILQASSQSSIQGIWYLLGERMLTPSLPGVATISVEGREYLRPYGTFSHPNTLAGFYLLVHFFMRWLGEHDLTPSERRAVLVLQYLSPFLILASFSKTAIAVYVLGTIVLVIADRDYRRCVLCLGARTITLLVLLAVFMIPAGDPASISKRLTLSAQAARVIWDHALWGVGAGSYIIAQSALPTKTALTALYQPVHNIALLGFAELGIAGTMIVWVIIRRIRIMVTGGVHAWVLCGAVIATGMFDHYWLTQMQTRALLCLVLIVTMRYGPTLLPRAK